MSRARGKRQAKTRKIVDTIYCYDCGLYHACHECITGCLCDDDCQED